MCSAYRHPDFPGAISTPCLKHAQSSTAIGHVVQPPIKRRWLERIQLGPGYFCHFQGLRHQRSVHWNVGRSLEVLFDRSCFGNGHEDSRECRVHQQPRHAFRWVPVGRNGSSRSRRETWQPAAPTSTPLHSTMAQLSRPNRDWVNLAGFGNIVSTRAALEVRPCSSN